MAQGSESFLIPLKDISTSVRTPIILHDSETYEVKLAALSKQEVERDFGLKFIQEGKSVRLDDECASSHFAQHWDAFYGSSLKIVEDRKVISAAGITNPVEARRLEDLRG